MEDINKTLSKIPEILESEFWQIFISRIIEKRRDYSTQLEMQKKLEIINELQGGIAIIDFIVGKPKKGIKGLAQKIIDELRQKRGNQP